jgi:hypothetical protein
MKKFEFNKQINYFTIDPAYLAEGLAEAKGEYPNIRVMSLSLRKKQPPLDVKVLSQHTWILGLNVHPDVPISKADVPLLERLINLEVLAIKEHAPLDFSAFRKLKKLTIMSGTDLPGLDKARSLEGLYLGLWNGDVLPEVIGRIAATTVRISVAKKLTSIEPLCDLTHLQKLNLQIIKDLDVGKEINGLKSLQDLYVEKCGWTDFSPLRIHALRVLFASTVKSLRFILQLKNLERLSFWDCVDGDLIPVLEHPKLKHVDFTPEKKHYTHREADLQQQLTARGRV